MIGLILLVLSSVLFCIILYVAITSKRNIDGLFIPIAQRVRNSANLELGLHIGFVASFAFGLAFFVDESGSALLQDIFPTFESRIYGWIVPIFIVIVINIVRHARFGLVVDDETGMILSLQQFVDESSNPEEGVADVIQHIDSHPENYKEGTLYLLLNFLSKRDDEVGREARKRLKVITSS
ncbi:MAG: hypothetical protein ACTSWA_11990 [Candidatus Thorarchaeota archaeon]